MGCNSSSNSIGVTERYEDVQVGYKAPTQLFEHGVIKVNLYKDSKTTIVKNVSL